MRSTDTQPRSVTNLVAAVLDNLQDLVHTEARLVTTELREEAGRAAAPLAQITLGVALGFYGLGFFLVTSMVLLSRFLPLWASAAVIGTLVSAVGAGLFINGRRAWKRFHFATKQTTKSLQENFTWNPAVRHSPLESKLRAVS